MPSGVPLKLRYPQVKEASRCTPTPRNAEYGATLLIRNRRPLGPYNRTMSKGDGSFIMSKVPLWTNSLDVSRWLLYSIHAGPPLHGAHPLPGALGMKEEATLSRSRGSCCTLTGSGGGVQDLGIQARVG